jgi:hypothetical protein
MASSGTGLEQHIWNYSHVGKSGSRLHSQNIMNILHVCYDYESSVKKTFDLCEKHLKASCSVLVIDQTYNQLHTSSDGGTAPYYTHIEEEVFNPDVILSYGDMDEAFIINPKCPVIHMGEKYAMALWKLPNSDNFHRDFRFNPKACKVMYQSHDIHVNAAGELESEPRPVSSGDVFDVWVFPFFDAYDIACTMAWGCIPVAPAMSGATDWIANGITGALYRTEQERDMLVDELVNDPMLRRDMSTAARQWVYEHADIKILQDLLDRIKGL